MNSITSVVKRNPQATFWTIAYLVSGGGYTLSRLYPNDLWILVLYGIFLGGALVTGIADGRAGLKTYFGRLVRFRAGIHWYAIALLTPFALSAIAFGVNILLGAEVIGQLPALSAMPMVFLLYFLTNALGEEPGFRGFSLPRLMAGRSAFAASLIIGVLHAIWHLPLVIGGDMPVIDLLHPLCGAFLFTWIFNHTNGSVFIAMLLHASNDIAGGFFSSVFTGTDGTFYHVLSGGVFVVMAILLRALAGRELGRQSEPPVWMAPVEQPLPVK